MGRRQGGKGAGCSPSIRLRIFQNRSLDTATSAIWSMNRRPWRTIELLFEPAGFAFARGLGIRFEVHGVIFSGNLRARQQTTRASGAFSQRMVVQGLIVTSSGIPE